MARSSRGSARAIPTGTTTRRNSAKTACHLPQLLEARERKWPLVANSQPSRRAGGTESPPWIILPSWAASSDTFLSQSVEGHRVVVEQLALLRGTAVADNG